MMLLATACASAPPTPPVSLNQAKRAIAAAEKVDASHYAVAELDEARQKLLAADKAQAVNAKLNRGANALIEEMQRTGDQL